jgi:hypothetical protein
MLLGANQYVSKLLAKPEATSRLLKRLDIFKQMPNLFIDDYTFWTNVTSQRTKPPSNAFTKRAAFGCDPLWLIESSTAGKDSLCSVVRVRKGPLCTGLQAEKASWVLPSLVDNLFGFIPKE